jgi:predicted SprT family Zn-dependent metalloprotease
VRINTVIGRRIGTIIVSKRLEKNDKKEYVYECLCDCGVKIRATSKEISWKKLSCKDCRMKMYNRSGIDNEKARLFLSSKPARPWSA